MLTATRPLSDTITEIENKGRSIVFKSEARTIFMEFKTENIVHIKETVRDDLKPVDKPGVVFDKAVGDYEILNGEIAYAVYTGKILTKVDKATGRLSFYDAKGSLLFKEQRKASFAEYKTYLLTDSEQETEVIKTPDGEKTIIKDPKKVYNGDSYHITYYPVFGDEALYGLGQHEEGFGSLRDKVIYVHQGNRKIAIPFIVSTKGYGILFDTYSPMIFNDNADVPFIYNESAHELDYYVINGGDPDGAVRGYRTLTGKASMLPKWAYGFVQSKERYETSKELIDTVKEARKRDIGIDCIVLDWMSWEDGKWGQKTFDKKRFPDAGNMVYKLHKDHARFMISVWPTTDPSCKDLAEFKKAGLLINASTLYNPYLKKGRDMYFKQIKEEILPAGTDAFWCDSSEPLTPEWSLKVRPEASAAYHEYSKESGLRFSDELSNAYCYYHAQGIYDGWIKEQENITKGKRLVNLTRSAYTGQQRLGTVMWSGDISASWDTLRRQIGAGLNFCASGMPYWTTDVGAFFVKPGDYWYWDGDFEDPIHDNGYKELYTRWFEWACFLPMFRCHGTDCDRELWAFGDKGDMFYDAMVKTDHLRYELMPYIYSEAGKVWLKDASLIKNLSFAFPDDKNVWDITDQYMFGESLMVCPVIKPMYFMPGNRMLEEKNERSVYLPGGTDWYDFYTGKKYTGGNTITVEAPIDRIPLFVKDKSIIPMTEFALSTDELSKNVTYKVFSDTPCEYEMYEDAGDGYGYERGEYTLTLIKSEDIK